MDSLPTQIFSSTHHRMKEYLKLVLNSALHLESVTEDALDLSRLENNKFSLFKEVFDLRTAVSEVCEIMKFPIQQKKLQFELNFSDSVPEKILSDKKRFKQVLFNLMGNAIKFTFEGFIKVNVDFNENQGQLKTEVQDSGLGIKQDDLIKLFKFFGCLSKSKDVNRGGMGFGLTISQMIIRQLGGEIAVSSVPNEGSNFSFTIPIDNEALKEFTQQENMANHDSGTNQPELLKVTTDDKDERGFHSNLFEN